MEEFFTNEKYYRAMKNLKDKEKLVLFLTIIEERTEKEASVIINTSRENISKIKLKAIKNFLNN